MWTLGEGTLLMHSNEHFIISAPLTSVLLMILLFSTAGTFLWFNFSIDMSQYQGVKISRKQTSVANNEQGQNVTSCCLQCHSCPWQPCHDNPVLAAGEKYPLLPEPRTTKNPQRFRDLVLGMKSLISWVVFHLVTLRQQLRQAGILKDHPGNLHFHLLAAPPFLIFWDCFLLFPPQFQHCSFFFPWTNRERCWQVDEFWSETVQQEMAAEMNYNTVACHYYPAVNCTWLSGTVWSALQVLFDAFCIFQASNTVLFFSAAFCSSGFEPVVCWSWYKFFLSQETWC